MRANIQISSVHLKMAGLVYITLPVLLFMRASFCGVLMALVPLMVFVTFESMVFRGRRICRRVVSPFWTEPTLLDRFSLAGVLSVAEDRTVLRFLHACVHPRAVCCDDVGARIPIRSEEDRLMVQCRRDHFYCGHPEDMLFFGFLARRSHK